MKDLDEAKAIGQLIAYEKIFERITQMLNEYEGSPTARIILTELGDYTCFLSDSVEKQSSTVSCVALKNKRKRRNSNGKLW